MIQPYVSNWKKPITIARHAYGDVYKGTEYRVARPRHGDARRSRASDGTEFVRRPCYDFECPGVLQGLYNKDSSIEAFAHSCFNYALSTKQDLWFSAKDTISKQYDQTFKLIFQRIYDEEYKDKFESGRHRRISTPSSTTRSRASSARRAASSGPARITTATS